MAIRVLGLASGVTTLEDHRHAIAALVTPAGILEARGGLFPGVPGAGDLVTVSAMQAKVTPFYAWIDGTSAALQAGYDLTSDADAILTFDAGEPAVARVDRVIARVKHTAYDSSGATVGSVEVLKGQASGAATAMPPSSELLWEVTVPAGASAGSGGINFTTARTDKRRYTTASGGLLPVANQAERDAVTAPYNGMPVWRRDRGWQEVYDGAAWRVQGVPVVASVADLSAITNPVNGQAAFNTGDGILYRYNSTAAAWRVVDYRVTQTLAASAASITISNIPTYLRRLKLSVTSRADSARMGQWLYLRVNGASGTSYRSAYVGVDAAGGSTVAKTTSIDAAQMVVGFMPGAQVAAGIFGTAVIDIVGWDSPHAGFLGVTAQSQVLQDATNTFLSTGGGQYKPAGPFTSLTLLPELGSFVSGTEVTLEGTP